MNQTRRNPDRLHHAPDSSAAVLLLIDVINDLEFEGAEALLPSAIKMAAVLAAFKRRAKEQGIPVRITVDAPRYSRRSSRLV